jgi:hypothetical protein
MKQILIFLLFVFLATFCFAEESTVKFIFRDYNLYDANIKALSIGVCTWTDNDYECAIGGYLNFNFISLLKDQLRFGGGFVAIPGDERAFEIRLDTSLTTRIFDFIEVGAYWCPFWGMIGKDDPFGLLIGYTF